MQMIHFKFNLVSNPWNPWKLVLMLLLPGKKDQDGDTSWMYKVYNHNLMI